MEVSSTSMNVASVTAIATSQGLPPPETEPLLAGGGVISLCPKPQSREHLEMRDRGFGFQVVWVRSFPVGMAREKRLGKFRLSVHRASSLGLRLRLVALRDHNL